MPSSSSGTSGPPVGPIFGGILLLVGNYLLFRSFGNGDILGLLLGVGIMSVGGKLLAPVVAGVLAEPAGKLFYPGRKLSKPQAAYSIPRARRAFGKHEEAIDELKKITQEDPGELEAWVEMIDIALVEFKDPDRALALYHEGLTAQLEPEKRQALGRTFQVMMNRYRAYHAAEARNASPRIELPPEDPSEKPS